MLIPINFDNSHWCAIIVKVQARRIYCYGPLNQTPFKRATEAIANSLENLGLLDYNVVALNNPIQFDEFSCGVFVCWMFIRQVVKGAPHDMSAHSLTRRRFELFDYVLTGRPIPLLALPQTQPANTTDQPRPQDTSGQTQPRIQGSSGETQPQTKDVSDRRIRRHRTRTRGAATDPGRGRRRGDADSGLRRRGCASDASSRRRRAPADYRVMQNSWRRDVDDPWSNILCSLHPIRWTEYHVVINTALYLNRSGTSRGLVTSAKTIPQSTQSYLAISSSSSNKSFPCAQHICKDLNVQHYSCVNHGSFQYFVSRLCKKSWPATATNKLFRITL